MTTIHDLLDEYAAMATDMRTEGMYLERLTKAYWSLPISGRYASSFDDVAGPESV